MAFLTNYNPFLNPACVMHQLDLGIFRTALDLTIDFIKIKCPRGTIRKFEQRWNQLNVFPGGKAFGRGVTGFNFTAGEYKQMAMGLPFVVRGLIDTTGSKCVGLEELAVTYLLFRYLLAQEGGTKVSWVSSCNAKSAACRL